MLHREETKERFNEAPIHESGKYYRARLVRLKLVASMRPRFMNRGSPVGEHATEAAVSLQ